MPSLFSRDNPSYPSSSSGSNTTPYLFFIALGIGVVFINIWVIIGVRYYFKRRRNAIEANNYRNNSELASMSYVYHQGSGLYYHTRAPVLSRRLPGSNLSRSQQQPRKLLTLEQLDELCPVQKYREWASRQKQHGLPTEGGISNQAAQALEKSLQQPSIVTNEISINDENDDTKITSNHHPDSETKATAIVATTSSIIEDETAVEDEDTGDTCAICIDSLEPDDDIRALDCHHVFHTDCITPWLTTRRALCPLCKRDYYQGPSEEEQQSQQQQQPQVSSLITPPPPSARLATTSDPRSISPPPAPYFNTSNRRRQSSSSNSSSSVSSILTRPHTIGTTGVMYEPEPTPIYDEIRLEVRDLMARIRRARENHRSTSREQDSQSLGTSEVPRTLPNNNSLARSSSPPSPTTTTTNNNNTTTRSGGGWRFWRTRPAVAEQV
ncbi:uncharacterized protein SAPINGB_P000351 [Magnusiomyces paraingens]|uniref:RING-type domain-containing protein n=1 Tax=Magnusiomyces paraingens TaxID=2606893 RepID=A0A5E8B3N0_9ASCO|nr:uncharacterized protein SAPINGB_P000351 [Saprochaete ingens]VVT44243.1 unnamed protein product [Saprochaete ingens]